MDILNSQKNIIDFLNNSKKQNRLAHAYMFEGSKGVGKLEAALYFVCMLWCENETPCLKCNTCKQILSKQFLNLVYIYNDKKEILTEQINNLQKEFTTTAPLDGSRIYIIEDAHKMSVKLQNRLLKFIEEPDNTQTYGILLTNSPDLIIPTIKSRVISLSFKELSYDFLNDKLKQLNVDSRYSNILPHIKNNVDKCLELLNGSIELDIIELVYKFIEQLNKRDIILFYKENQDLLNSNLPLFLNLLQELYNDIYKVMINQEPKTFINIDYTLLKTLYKSENVNEIIKELVELEYKLRYNININLHVVKLLITLNGGVIR